MGVSLLIALTGAAVTFSLVLLGLLIRTRASTHALLEQRTADLRYLALHDPLTHLPNRRSLIESGERALARSRRAGTTIAVLFIDLDGFKNVNDTLGHAAGDDLLCEIASELRRAAGETNIVGRIGGDEFVVLFEGWTSDAAPLPVAQRLLDAVRAAGEEFASRNDIGGMHPVTASVGIAHGMPTSALELVRDADAAMYRAKSLGKNTCVASEHAPSESCLCSNGRHTRALATAGMANV